jgi:hypothetical protein
MPIISKASMTGFAAAPLHDTIPRQITLTQETA